MSPATIGKPFDLLIFHTWWAWDPAQPSWNSVATHWFNLLEGGCWWGIAISVWRRFARSHCHPVEIGYGLAFATFGLTDFVEAQVLTSWLLWLKLANLLALWRLRRFVLARCYPHSRTY